MSTVSFLRQLSSRLMLYLPMALMGLLALGSWWLARLTPSAPSVIAAPVQRQEPDYFLTNFSVQSFDAQGQLISEMMGKKATHFPGKEVLEIDQARFRSSRLGLTTTGQSDRAFSNEDGSEVQLLGNAVVVRETGKNPQGQSVARVEFRGEFLHVFARMEELKSHKPVVVVHGTDQFSGDTLRYSKRDGIVELTGRVRVRLDSRASAEPR
jgi:lipopolysaccharide export system protein LptC